MANSSLILRLPDPSAVDGDVTALLGQFQSLIARAQSFTSGDLNALQQVAGTLPVPDGTGMIRDVLDNFGQMAQRIPANPESLTVELREGLERLQSELGGLNGVLGPIAAMAEVVKPLLQQADLLNNSITRINSFVTDLAAVSGGLNLANVSEQIEYFSRILGVFPELSNQSPFKELRAQVETIKAWLTLNGVDLSEHFRAQIQSLADALPVRLDAVMQAGVGAVVNLETSVAALDRNTWCLPYQQALLAVESMDLNDFSQVGNHASTLDAQIAQLTGIADMLTQGIRTGLASLNALNAPMFAQDLIDGLSTVLSVIAPERPGVLAVIMNHVRLMIGGLEASDVRQQVAVVDKEVDKLFGQLDLSAFTGSIQDTTDTIVRTVGTVDRALVEVSTVLSNLVTELRTRIGSVDLNGMVSQIQTAFTQLRDAVIGLSGQINSIVQQVDQFVQQIGDEIDNLDITALADAFRALLAQITAVLEDPAVRQVLDAAKHGIADMAANLQDVTLVPVFDEVIEQMDKMKEDLADIDISDLNDVLKAALRTALEVVRRLDFADDVAKELNDTFAAILAESLELVEPLRDKFQELEGKIDQLRPGTLVAAQLASPFESLVDELKKIQPAQLLEPLEELHGSLLEQLDPLNPTRLLAPLTELHGQLLNSLRSLSPHELLSPLSEVMGEITKLLDQLKIESFIAEVTDAINLVQTFASKFSLIDQLRSADGFAAIGQIQMQAHGLLEKFEEGVDQFLDKLVSAVPDMDMSALQPALDALRSSSTSIESHVATPEVLTRFETVRNTLKEHDFQGCMAELTRRWSVQKARFEAVTPPPQSAAGFENLKQKVHALSPLALLGGPAALVSQLAASMGTAHVELTQAKASMSALMTEGRDNLRSLLPAESTAEGFRQLLRDDLDAQLGIPAKDVLSLLKTRMTEFEEIFDAIKVIGLKLQTPIQVLTLGPESIGAIGDALLDAKNKITRFNLGFLEDELQGVVDEVTTQLAALDPAALAAQVDATFQTALNTVRQLYPQSAIDTLDTTYRVVVLTDVEGLHPEKTIAEPLDVEFEKILQLKENLSVDALFEPLTAKLDGLGDELDDGLDRAAKAFNEMLAAIPTG